jgi:hypothetical protein
MREYVRTWINEWDLRRLDPTYQPEIEVTAVGLSYGEDAEFQRESVEEENGSEFETGQPQTAGSA